ncbi:hypothetical protein SCLCIDRAFT_1221697 [Scleroderma citrinum Foug A]|uniref:Uncharacterized protein n=1 Tax=Scleroderma citrinum Foug A TaxID=1036808 RepID=A0A0C3DEH0_9AGAM|nr:hypothetical protein SCLCIDRAFT_1221697 [Scleroderma citrinum Foug A]
MQDVRHSLLSGRRSTRHSAWLGQSLLTKKSAHGSFPLGNVTPNISTLKRPEPFYMTGP